MSETFEYDVFLSHSSKDKAIVRPLAERLRANGLKVWFDEWALKPGDSIPAKIEEGLERPRVLMLCMSVNAFGSDWAQLESGTFRFRDPLNKERRFLPLLLDDSPIKGSLAQFLYINWLPRFREQEYEKLLEACMPSAEPAAKTSSETDSPEAIRHVARLVRARLNEWKRMQDDFEAEARKYHDVQMSVHFELRDGPTIKGKIPKPNYAINLWQYFGSTGCQNTMERLRSIRLTKFGMAGAEITAVGLIVGEQTDLFRKMALRAGTLLPDEISHIIVGELPSKFEGELGPGKPIFAANSNPLAKWLNMMLVATTSSHPERFKNGILAIDSFAASLSVFDYFSIQLSTENSAADLINQQGRPPSLRPIGDAWSGVRSVLQQAYSTKVIKGILGGAGLPTAKVEYSGSYKGPFLDGADHLVSAMDDDSRDRFVIACIEEVIAVERAKIVETPNTGEKSGNQTLQRLQVVLGRFGHDMNTYES